MVSSDQTSFIEERLANQLHFFSELSEILTLRLLELEERIISLEKSQEIRPEEMQSSSQQLLRDSESKVRH